jgi:glycosyltransferase involved in cell wall biosynthesis
MKTKVSVALCTYNGAKFILDQLDSIENQTRKPDEIVICDDGSTDLTLKIIDGFAKRSTISVCCYSNKANLKTVKNFEKAIDLCTGEIVFLADQDDYWLAEKVEKMLKLMEQDTTVDILFSNATIVDKDLSPLGYSLWNTIGFGDAEKALYHNGKTLEVLSVKPCVTGATMALRKHIFPYLAPFSPNWGHDEWMAFLVAGMGKINFIDEQLVLYRQHEYNQIGGLKKEKERGFLKRHKWNTQVRKHSIAKAHSFYQKKKHGYQEAVDRLHHLGHTVSSDLAKFVNEREKHYKLRLELPHFFVKRAVVIINELVRGNYHAYSDGFRDAVKDFLLLP